MVDRRGRVRELDRHARATTVRNRTGCSHMGFGDPGTRCGDTPRARHRWGNGPQCPGASATRPSSRRGGDDSEVRGHHQGRRRAGVTQRSRDRAGHLLQRRRPAAGLLADPAFRGGVRLPDDPPTARRLRTRHPLPGRGWSAGVQCLPRQTRIYARRRRTRTRTTVLYKHFHLARVIGGGVWLAAAAGLGRLRVPLREKSHLPQETWPPTSWYADWVSGRDVFDLPREEIPIEMRWLVYQKPNWNHGNRSIT
jgi:hypothetical protein